jgi:methyl-accepting chemotaxis protein
MTVKTGSTSASMTDTDESIHAISSSAAEMSNSIDTVTSSIQEMNSSLAEVSRNCLTELTTTNAAAQQANDAVEQMERLKSASKKVSSILDTITDIADQTNLLALNATIEAARAGAAGKSFAVVATEVKELARQTSTAVSDISGQIVEMQQSSNAVIKTVSQITRVIGDINAISNTISSAVEEQSVTMNQISRNMGEANSAASEIAGNVTASATGISGVKNLILDVDKSSHDTSDRLSTVKSSADKFAEIAGGLTNILRKFTLSA